MNTLEMSTYAEPDFLLIDEFVDPKMNEKQRAETRQKTIDMYANFTDDDWKDLGDNYWWNL